MKNYVLLLLLIAPLSLFAQKNDQTITFDPIPEKLPEYYFLKATASSGLKVTYKSSNPRIVNIIGNMVSITGSGDAFITANQAGNSEYNAAPPVRQRVVVRKSPQSLSLGIYGPYTFGDPVLTLYSSGAHQNAIYTSSDPAFASIEDGRITIKHAGVVSITADNLGDRLHLPAKTSVTVLLIKKKYESISLAVPETFTYGNEPYALKPFSDSGNPITLFSKYDSIAEVVDGRLIIKGVGTTTIFASVPESENYLGATKLVAINVIKSTQQITFNSIPSKPIGSSPVPISATSSSGLPVLFKVARSGVASLAGNNLVTRGIGTAIVVAYQPGNQNYLPAAEVSQNFVVTGPAPSNFIIAGFSSEGGANNSGNIFSLNSSGSSFSNNYSFPSSSNVLPRNGVIKASDNKVYGIAGNEGVFSMNTDGTGYTVLHKFVTNDGGLPIGSLLEASNGYLYGINQFGGLGAAGVAYRIKKDGTDFSIVKKFGGSGYYPGSTLIQANDGMLYGITSQGGVNGYGTLYKMDLDGQNYVEIIPFGAASTAKTPIGAVLQGPDNYLYGVTASGGASNLGCIYKVKTDGSSFSRLFDFNGANGEAGSAALLLASDGTLYGTTIRGGANGKGIIFSINTNGTSFTKLMDFDGTNGATSLNPLCEGSDGLLYGLTSEGGSSNLGVAYRIAKNGTGYTRLVDFTGINGSNPQFGPLYETQNGFFIGLTYLGGNSNVGTIFSLTSSGTHSIVKDFPQAPATPWSMVSSTTHNFGITFRGGQYGSGNFFRTLLDGTEYTSLYDFQGDFFFPERLTYMRDDVIWGVGREGVFSFNYCIFKINADGTNFQRVPMGPSETDRISTFLDYSPEYVYGVSMAGTIFRIKRDLTDLEKLSSIPGGTTGSYIFYAPVLTNSGYIMGATLEGGNNYNNGVAFKIDTDNKYTKLFNLNSTTGFNAQASLAINGGLCISTTEGGANNKGTLLVVSEDGFYDKILDLTTQTGSMPSSMIQTNEGYIYVSTRSGGANGFGTIFRILPDGSAYTKLYDYKSGESKGTNGLLTQKLSQTLTSFDAIPQKEYLDQPFALNAVGSSGLPARFISSNTNVATVQGNIVTIRGAGTTVISAQLPAVGNYLPSNSIERTLTVVKSNQTLVFEDIPVKKYGDPDFKLKVTASSGLPVHLTSSDDNIARMIHGQVTLVTPGTTTITASVTSSPNFNGIASIERQLVVQKGNHGIKFDPIATRFIDSTYFGLKVSSSAQLPIVLDNSNDLVGELNTSFLRPLAAGETKVTASARGNDKYVDAADVIRQMKVLKFQQRIAFDTIQSRSIDDEWLLIPGFGATSGLPVTITTESDRIRISNDTLKMLRPGHVTLTASQAGDDVYNAAESITRTFCINPPKPIITEDLSFAERPILTSSSITGNQWYKNGEPMLDKTGPSITVSESNTYTLTVSIDGCVSPKADPKSYIVTGLEENGGSIVLYPNPSSNRLFIQLPTNLSADFVVYDMMGREQKKISSSTTNVEMDVASLASGQYLLKVVTDTEVFVLKFRRM